MSYSDPQLPQRGQQPFSSSDEGSFWQSFVVPVEQTPNSNRQFDNPPPLKKYKASENPTIFPPSASNTTRLNPPNAPVGKGTSHIFYKTRLCAQFRDGTCRNGDNCTFAHGNNDLRHPPLNWQELVREKERETGNGTWGDDQRNVQRMKICKKYFNGEECPYGDKCNFVHERPPQPIMPRPDSVDQRESSAISIGVTGDPKSTTTSTSEQVLFWKTKICIKWEMGICPYGDRCSFAHGQSELRLSSAPYESEQAINRSSALRKSTPFALTFNSATNNLVVGSPNEDEEQEKTLKWKLRKKINRIYADWIDNLSPPDRSPAAEDIV